MRLWSLHPKYLDARGLVALWREGLLARKVLHATGLPWPRRIITFTCHDLRRTFATIAVEIIYAGTHEKAPY